MNVLNATDLDTSQWSLWQMLCIFYKKKNFKALSFVKEGKKNHHWNKVFGPLRQAQGGAPKLVLPASLMASRAICPVLFQWLPMQRPAVSVNSSQLR